jgi:hypothetical protein
MIPFINVHNLQKEEASLEKVSDELYYLHLNSTVTDSEEKIITTILDEAIARNRKAQKEFYKSLNKSK